MSDDKIEFSTCVIRDNLIIIKKTIKSDGTIIWAHRKIKNTTPNEEMEEIMREFGFLHKKKEGERKNE